MITSHDASFHAPEKTMYFPKNPEVGGIPASDNKETIPTIAENHHNKILSLYGFASDQSPKVNAAYHWAPFMGHIVPVHTGAEMLAKRFDMNVIFLKVKKVKRGYYEASFEILSEDVKSVPNYEITNQFLKLVEEQILEAPEYYLWTHKRWKHKNKAQ